MPLNEVATLQRGFDLPVQARRPGDVPIFAANGPVGTHDVVKVRGPGVVTGRSGTIGRVHFVEKDFWPLNTSLYVKDFHGNDPRFVYRLLAQMDLSRYHEGSGVPTLNRNNVHSIEVPVPPLDDQRRIVDILDRADALRARRREALTCLDELTQSIFLAMFGDANPNIAVTRLSDAVDVQIGPFGSLLHVEDYINNGVPLVNPMHIVGGRIVPNATYTVSLRKAETLELYRLRSGDVIMGRRGEMGRCAVVEPQHVGLLCGTGSLILRPRPGRIDPIYLARLLSTPRVRERLQAYSLGSTLPNLNRSIVAGLEIPLPQFEAQEKFHQRIDRLDNLRSKMRRHLFEMDCLLGNFQQRAFAGML